ncbi:ATP-binding protein [Bradyrhizobium sp. 2S1]|uniref:ATP-binding protein n=1 Tax=Bradyrhizobium sp. 2S1 TaxID=1404429 RepID=UPI001407C072|nr:ATP-binding protein [Bradyrhizobium sp. 2S1]MCK7665048.1 ATP-binding protein [Bradyrhizobium sp. 2S1]
MSTPRQASALVVRGDCLANDRLVDQIFNSLAADRRITLVAPEPVTLEQALILVDLHEELGVIVLVGFEDQVTQIIDKIRKRRPAINFASFPTSAPTFSLNLSQPYGPGIVEILNRPVSVGTIELVLGSPGSPEFIEIITLLLNGSSMIAGNSDRGVLVPFPSSQTLGKAPRSVAMAETPDPYITKALEAALIWADAAVDALLKFWEADPKSMPGLPLTWEELRAWLRRIVCIQHGPTEELDCAFKSFFAVLDDPKARQTPLARIATLIDHDPLTLKLLLIILSPELDFRFHRIFGAMQDDFSRRHPTVALACAILAAATSDARPFNIRIGLAGLERLRRSGLIESFKSGIPSADAALHVEPAAFDWILSGDIGQLLAAPALAPLVVKPAGVGRLLPTDRRDAVWVAMRRIIEANEAPAALLLTGSEPGWLQVEARFLANDEPICISPVSGAEAAVAQAVQAALLAGRRLIVDLSDWSAAAEAFWAALTPLLTASSTPPFILTQNPAPLLAATTQTALAVVCLPAVKTKDWEGAIALLLGRPIDKPLAAELAARYRLRLDQLPDAKALAEAAAADACRETPNADDWRAGFRAAAGAHLPALARRIEPQPCPNREDGSSCLDRVVLPEMQKDQLRAILDHVRHSHEVLDEWGFGALLQARGVSALFSGDSGTGKTLAAYAVASALAADLYVVDLARIVSKYIGETEKNLDIVFNEAERAGAVLLFDEADALFGKRSEVRDAHDRYANIEVAYLLQRMELFDGLAILTTNHPENVDPAFSRRLRFSIEFPRPDATARLAIWEQSLPKGEHREEDLGLEFLARRLDLTGGSIRQIALHAAMGAARDKRMIAKDHVNAATRIELRRLGAYGEIGKLERVA